MFDDEREIEYRENGGKSTNLTTVIVVALIAFVVLVLGVVSLLIKTPNVNGVDQPVIVVLFQTIRGDETAAEPTPAGSATPTATPTEPPTATPMATPTAPPAEPPAAAPTNPPVVENTAAPSGNAGRSQTGANVPAECEQLTRTGTNTWVSINISVPAGFVQHFGGAQFESTTDPVLVTVTGPYQGRHRLFHGMFCEAVPAGSVEADMAKAAIVEELRADGIACDLGNCPTEIELPLG